MELTGGAGSKLVRQRIAHYEILERLGEGGMGVVFKARDTRLDRLVALKTLRAETVEDSDRRFRLIREAKSASALNHPNIVHIYEAGSEDGCDYIAMEYVAGAPLSHLIARHGLPWQDSLRYAVQIADAVDAAHSAGIVHRDLKPGNVMITERGLVKVLDFGLAKVFAEHHSPDESERNATMTMTVQTPVGVTAGTPAYMSPEQISAEALDVRSDIFSFGVMLYEMIAGALPFRGESRALVMASVLRDEPVPPGVSCPELPPEVERIVMRCLRKDKAKRFQHIVEVKLALEDLLESQTRTGSGLALPAVRAARRTKSRVWIFAASGALTVAGLGFAGWEWFHREPAPVVDSAPKRLTSDGGLTTEPSISPDGKLLAFSSDRSGEGRMDIWVKQIGGGEPIRLTHDPVNATQPDFSPDGTQIVFHSDREAGGLYLVSALGGNERKIADQGLAPHFSPDGKSISWWEGTPIFERDAKIFVMDLATGAKHEVKTGMAAASWPAWSDDGKDLLFRGQSELSNEPERSGFGWFIVAERGGTPVRVQTVPGPWRDTQHLFPRVWRQGRVIFTAESTGNASDGIYIANLSQDGRIGAASRRLTPGITAEVDPSLSNDGTLVFASLSRNLSLYSQPITEKGRNAGPLDRLTRAFGNDQYPSVSSDGTRIAFQSARTGDFRIWMKDLTKGTETAAGEPATSDTVPHLNPAGTLVAWAEPEGKAVVAEPFPGGPVRRLCDDCQSIAGWSPDGRRFLYSDYSAHSFAGVFDIASGRRIVLRHPQFSLFPRSFSPDGGWIAAIAEHAGGFLIAPVPEDGIVSDSEWIWIGAGPGEAGWPTWSADGRLLYFTSERDGFWCIWAQPLAERTKRPIGSAFPVEHFHGALRMRTGSTRITLARNKIVFSLEEQSGNVWRTYLDLRSKAIPSR